MKKMLKVVAMMLALTIAFGCIIAFAENNEEGTTEEVVIEAPQATEELEVQEAAPEVTEALAEEVVQETAPEATEAPAEEVAQEVAEIEEVVEADAAEGEDEPEIIEIPDEVVPLYGGSQPKVEIGTNCNVASMELGDTLVMTAKLSGFDGIDYSLNWQVSDGGEWEDIKGETEEELTVVITEENADCSWRLAVIVSEA